MRIFFFAFCKNISGYSSSVTNTPDLRSSSYLAADSMQTPNHVQLGNFSISSPSFGTRCVSTGGSVLSGALRVSGGSQGRSSGGSGRISGSSPDIGRVHVQTSGGARSSAGELVVRGPSGGGLLVGGHSIVGCVSSPRVIADMRTTVRTSLQVRTQSEGRLDQGRQTVQQSSTANTHDFQPSSRVSGQQQQTSSSEAATRVSDHSDNIVQHPKPNSPLGKNRRVSAGWSEESGPFSASRPRQRLRKAATTREQVDNHGVTSSGVVGGARPRPRGSPARGLGVVSRGNQHKEGPSSQGGAAGGGVGGGGSALRRKNSKEFLRRASAEAFTTTADVAGGLNSSVSGTTKHPDTQKTRDIVKRRRDEQEKMAKKFPEMEADLEHKSAEVTRLKKHLARMLREKEN